MSTVGFPFFSLFAVFRREQSLSKYVHLASSAILYYGLARPRQENRQFRPLGIRSQGFPGFYEGTDQFGEGGDFPKIGKIAILLGRFSLFSGVFSAIFEYFLALYG